MKERVVAGRIGDLANDVETDPESVQRRRSLLDREGSTQDDLDAPELDRTRRLLESLAEGTEVRKYRTEVPCKVTRVELEFALAQRHPIMSPDAALAYADWLLSEQRGWSGARDESREAKPLAEFAEAFGFLQPEPASREGAAAATAARRGPGIESTAARGTVTPMRAVAARGSAPAVSAPARLAARLRPGQGEPSEHERREVIEQILALVRSDGPGEPLSADVLAAEPLRIAAQVRIHTAPSPTKLPSFLAPPRSPSAATSISLQARMRRGPSKEIDCYATS